MSRQLVLGSSSPYRKELLQRLHLSFDTFSPDIDESPLESETPQAMVERLSIEKAKAVAQQFPNAIIISGDQVAVCNGMILGKPNTLENATKQLKEISGQTVVFETGLCVFDSNSGKHQYQLIPTQVVFRELDDETIRRYLEKEPAFNCAGSFKSEGYGICLVKSIRNDDPTALIGLPLVHLTYMLEQAGIQVV